MNETEDKSDAVKNNKTDEVSASHYALQIALQTMKERCQLLQQRLSAVEEENLRLRIETQNNSRKTSEGVPENEVSKLEERITQLSRQKQKLTDHITMVVKENNQLWTRLSRVTEANQSLGNHLSKISDTLNKHPIEISKMTESEFMKNSDCTLIDVENKEESLEEISLKIIDTIRREKKVLEQQCEEMVELQTLGVTVEECGFNIGNGVIEEDIDDENVMEDISKLREKMKDEYKILKSQQAGLQAAIASLNILIAEKKNCRCKGIAIEDSKSTSNRSQEITMSTFAMPLNGIEKQLQGIAEPPATDINDMIFTSQCQQKDLSNNILQSNNDNVDTYVDEKICPMCSKFYDHNAKFDEFHEHVLSHFVNNGQDGDSLISNFENQS